MQQAVQPRTARAHTTACPATTPNSTERKIFHRSQVPNASLIGIRLTVPSAFILAKIGDSLMRRRM